MRQFKFVLLAIALLSPALLCAGQIYGTLTFAGRGVARANIKISCNSAQPNPGTTGADGSYRINVPQQAQCTLTLPDYAGSPSMTGFSNPNPAPYNLELFKRPDGNYELRRR